MLKQESLRTTIVPVSMCVSVRRCVCSVHSFSLAPGPDGLTVTGCQSKL